MFTAMSVKGIATTRRQHLTAKMRGASARLGLLLLLTAGLFACGPKGGGGPNSNQAGPSTNSSTAESDAAPSGAPARTEFKTGDAVPAGYLGYKVFGSWFSDHLSADAGKAPGTYLFVDLAVVNTDKKERPVPPLTLLDEAGKEYPASGKSASIERSVAQLGNLKPNVSNRAVAVFEAPKEHQYRLKIQGFSASETVTVTLVPASAPPKP